MLRRPNQSRLASYLHHKAVDLGKQVRLRSVLGYSSVISDHCLMKMLGVGAETRRVPTLSAVQEAKEEYSPST